MKRFASLAAAGLALALALGGCDKPSAESCEKALRNMQALLGTDSLNTTESLQGEIRRCRGGSHQKAVDCAIAAKTLAELDACDFERGVPHESGSGASLGSSSGSAGTK